MAEFPEEICRLVNQYVPWDRHHRSPTAELVRSQQFQAKQGKCIQRWRHAYIINGAYLRGARASWYDWRTTWEMTHEMLGVEEEIATLRDMEEATFERLDDVEETETDEEEDGGDEIHGLAMFEESD